MKIQKAVKEETIKVAIGEVIGVAAMLLIWLLIHLASPTVTFNFLVVVLAILGGAVAVLNFLLLGLFVQKATSIDGKDETKQFYKSTYRNRLLIQLLWGILSFVVPKLMGLPVLIGLAGVLPLLFPTYTIRAVGVKDALKGLSGKSSSGDKKDNSKNSKDSSRDNSKDSSRDNPGEY